MPQNVKSKKRITRVNELVFFGKRTTRKNLVVREGQNIDLYWDSRTTSGNLATLGIDIRGGYVPDEFQTTNSQSNKFLLFHTNLIEKSLIFSIN
jgi:hypothetical protein